jgi:branched-chain amino acid transport system substrate-binding protein
MYCLSPGIRPAPGSFAFSAGEETNAIATVVLRYLKSTSQTRFAALTATDGSGQDMDRSLDNALTLPEFKDMKLVAREHFGSADISVVAQTARIQSAQPQVVLVWCAGTPLGTALRAINETGLDVPVITSGANMNQRQIRSYDAFLPRTLLFSSQIAALRNAVGPGPIADAQRHFRRAMSAAGYQADAGYTLSWDPALLLIDALRARGSAATAADIRDFLATTAGWVGIDGIYDFRSTPQRGLDASSGLVSGWNALKDDFEPMSKRAGYPR